MPVVIREGSWRIWIFPKDHAPPHVHVYRHGGFSKVLLPLDGAPARLIKTQRMTQRDASAAVDLVDKYATILTLAWSAIHGTSNTN